MPAARTVHVIYDGRCAFCVRALAMVRRLDVWGVLRFHDATDREVVEARFPGLRGADLDHAMFAVAGDGTVSRGFFAFRRLLWVSPLMWPLLLLFYFPGARILGPRIYAWIARNRRSLGCRSSVCPVPPPSTPRSSGGRMEKGRVA